MSARQFLQTTAYGAVGKGVPFRLSRTARDRDGVAARQLSEHRVLAQGHGVVAIVATRQLATMAAIQNRIAFQLANDAANGEILGIFHLSK